MKTLAVFYLKYFFSKAINKHKIEGETLADITKKNYPS